MAGLFFIYRQGAVPGAETLLGPRSGFGRFQLAVAGWPMADQRTEKSMRRVTHFLHRAVEGRLVVLGWPSEAGKLTHELQRGGPDLLSGGGRFKVVQGLDTSAHRYLRQR